MSSTSLDARGELAATLKRVASLAGPVIVTDLGLVVMGVVDTVVVGRVGPEAIGAVGLGNIIFITVAVFGMGLMLGLDTVVSQAFGAGRIDECYRWLAHGLTLAVIMTAPLVLIALALTRAMPMLATDPRVLELVVPYMEISAWSIPAFLFFAAFRRFLLAVSVVRPIAVIVLIGNVANLLLAQALVLGWGPIPAHGVVGSAWATLVSRVDCALALGVVAVVYLRRPGTRWQVSWTDIEPARLLRLLGLGVPAALQASLEVGVFATATALVALLDVVSLSAHQIVLQIATLTFVVALGIGASGGVLVGQALGAEDPVRARRTGWTAIAAGPAFMGLGAIAFVLLPGPIVALFSTDPLVIEMGSRLLAVAAAFQLFDGLQAASTGVLRGVGDTRTPMISNLVAHWLVGLPVGSLLAFGLGMGVVGMWSGLSLGLALVGATLLATWLRRSRALVYGEQGMTTLDGAAPGNRWLDRVDETLVEGPEVAARHNRES